jgi:hypothetical protein
MFSSGATPLRLTGLPSQVEVVCSGIEALDGMLPEGGLPRGQLSEITGTRSCGKRTIAAAFCATTIAHERYAIWIDGSGGFYPLPPLEQGAPLDRLIVVRSSTADGGREGARDDVRAQGRDLRYPPRFPSARRRSSCPAALKAADILMQAGDAVTLVIIDLPARTRVPPRLLARLRLGAETSGAAVLFLTEAASRRRRPESLGTFISLQLSVERIEPNQLRVMISKSKRGRMDHHTMVTLDEPHGVRLDSTV